MIIDCHTHLNRYLEHQPRELSARVRNLRRGMDTHGVSHALVLTSYTVNEDRPSTDDVLQALDGDGRFGVVAGVSVPHLGTEQVSYLRGLLSERRIRGLKLYPGYQPFGLQERKLTPVYEMAAEHGVPVVIHTGDTYHNAAMVKYAHPLRVDEVAVRFRETRFVMGHLGNPWFTDAMQVVYKNENVWADISGFTLGAFEPRFEAMLVRKLNDVVAYINSPEKLMFGTDWPISDLDSYLAFAAKLDLTPEEREGLMWRNAARLFGIGTSPDGEGG